jgi:hypothetical protein
VTDATSGYSKSTTLIGYGDPDAPSATPNSLSFPHTEIGVLSGAQTLMVSAPNGDPVSLQFSSGDTHGPTIFPLSPGTCGTQTPCQVSIGFKPLAIGATGDTIYVTDLVTGEQTTIDVSGQGGVGSVSLSSSSLAFAARDVGTTSISQTVTLTNSGDAMLTLSGMIFAGANTADFPIESNTCGSTLAIEASCTIGISFDPTASGARSAILQIVSNAASSPDMIQLSGTAN